MDELPNGPYGTALSIPYDARWPATVAAWVLTVPGAHAFWDQFMLAVVTLADVPDVPDVPAAHRRDAVSTHELLVVALNPELGRITAVEDLEATYAQHRSRWLLPPNVSVQFPATGDEQARRFGWLAARAVLNGHLYVEPEGIRGAREAWTTAVYRALDHERDPTHGRVN